MRRPHALLALATAIAAVATAPIAHADDAVTYEIISSSVAAVNVEYSDIAGRQSVQQVALPWRTNATVSRADSNNTEVRADWRPIAGPSRWVTVRIYAHGSLLCETILDVGNATCYGGTRHFS
ncbi:hypothetical protein [Mycolicibacterium septicum]|uniref:hypothetical protein n=1 Tax=Mycolicibacterium septicum TaxID=98668 RepID=UPI002361148D|nr:hypothetical protein [Mycolicibacterium septicum]